MMGMNRKGRAKRVKKRKSSFEIMPFSELRREMEQTSEELARFLRNFRRVLKEVNDIVESALDKSYGKENTKELKYKKVEGDKDEDGIYVWESRQDK
jgi:hypothetical protein